MESPFPEPVPHGTRLIETFGWWPGEGARRLDRHLARMARSAVALGFAFDKSVATDRVAMLAGQLPLRCRLTLDQEGGFDLTTAPLGAGPAPPWRFRLHSEQLYSGDPWLQHKTTRRGLYDTARAALPDGLEEWVFLNERGRLAEGTITNIFLTMPDGNTLTPPLTAGVLPGILREEMLGSGVVKEADLGLAELLAAQAIHLGNSLRGFIPAQLSQVRLHTEQK